MGQTPFWHERSSIHDSSFSMKPKKLVLFFVLRLFFLLFSNIQTLTCFKRGFYDVALITKSHKNDSHTSFQNKTLNDKKNDCFCPLKNNSTKHLIFNLKYDSFFFFFTFIMMTHDQKCAQNANNMRHLLEVYSVE